MPDDILGQELVEAWRNNPRWRADFLADVTLELSKTGSLDAHEEVLRLLSPHLSIKEITELFRRLQGSLRLESEWKDEFLAIFPAVRDCDLPPSVNDEATSRRLADEDERAFASDIRRAWRDNPAWRDSLVFNAARELAKTGGLNAHARVWCALSGHLTVEEIVAVYRGLQQSFRPESEWRDAFLSIFPSVVVDDLPRHVVDEEESRRLDEEEL